MRMTVTDTGGIIELRRDGAIVAVAEYEQDDEDSRTFSNQLVAIVRSTYVASRMFGLSPPDVKKATNGVYPK